MSGNAPKMKRCHPISKQHISTAHCTADQSTNGDDAVRHENILLCMAGNMGPLIEIEIPSSHRTVRLEAHGTVQAPGLRNCVYDNHQDPLGRFVRICSAVAVHSALMVS